MRACSEPTIYKVYIVTSLYKGVSVLPVNPKNELTHIQLLLHIRTLRGISGQCNVRVTRLIRPISERNSTSNSLHFTLRLLLISQKEALLPLLLEHTSPLEAHFYPLSHARPLLQHTHTVPARPSAYTRIHAASTLSHTLRKTAKSQLCTCAWTSGVLLVTLALGTGLRCLAGQWVL